MMFNSIQAITKPFVSSILGAGLGGPVATMMSGLAGGGGGLGPIKDLLSSLQGLFGKSSGAAGGSVSPRPLPFSPANINISVAVNPLGALQNGSSGVGAAQDGAKTNAFANPFQQLLQTLEKVMQGLQGLQGGGAGDMAANFDKALKLLGSDKMEDQLQGQKLLQQGLSSPFSGPSGSGSTSSAGSSTSGAGSLDSMISKAGGDMDSKMDQAEKLMKSDSLEDQVKGQKMMQQVMRMFEMMSKMIEKRSEMQSKAIAAIK